MPLESMRRLIGKVYEMACEFFVASHLRHTKKQRPRLSDFVEDSLIREYGLKVRGVSWRGPDGAR